MAERITGHTELIGHLIADTDKTLIITKNA